MSQEILRNSQLSEFKYFISRYNPQKIFLVGDKLSYKISGAELFIKDILNIPVNFSDFNPNPQINDLKKGISIFNNGNFDLILAIGGGSVLDMAKLISIFAHQNLEIEEVLENQSLINNVKTPLLAIPTTSGTGAEATAFAVLYVDKVKYSVACESILPNYVYLSPEFSLSAPPYLTACTGLDAFCQAIESVWSVNSTPESETYAFEAVDLVWKNLYNAVNKNDEKAKSLMQEAAFLAGKAINITKTTAPHAISYAFTSYYKIPHGHAVSLSLPYFFEYNLEISEADCIDKKGSKKVLMRINKLLKIMNLNKDNLKSHLVSFFDSVGVNINISSLIEDFNSGIIIDNVNVERLKNNPREINEKVIADFLIENK